MAPTSQHHHPRLYTLLHKLDPAELPPLLPLSGKLERLCRTHQSFHKGKVGGGEPHKYEDVDDKWADYQRLEFMGDSILCLAVTVLVDDMHSSLTVGERTIIRDFLIANSTLSFISVLYKLPLRLLAASNLGHTLSNNPNIHADLFEAYCGAVLQEHGTSFAIAWIRGVFQSLMDAVYLDRKDIHYSSLLRNGIDPDSDNQQITNYVSLLNMWADKERKVIEYEKDPGSDISGFVRVDGKIEARLKGEEDFDTWMAVKTRLAKMVLDQREVDLEPLRLLLAPRTEADKATYDAARKTAKTEAYKAKKVARTLKELERISFITIDNITLEPISSSYPTPASALTFPAATSIPPSTAETAEREEVLLQPLGEESSVDDDDGWSNWLLVSFTPEEPGLPPVRVKETFVEDGEWISLTLVPIPTPKPYVYKPAEWRAKREAKKKKVPEVEASVADLEKIQTEKLSAPAVTESSTYSSSSSSAVPPSTLSTWLSLLPSSSEPSISEENPLKRKAIPDPEADLILDKIPKLEEEPMTVDTFAPP